MPIQILYIHPKLKEKGKIRNNCVMYWGENHSFVTFLTQRSLTYLIRNIDDCLPYQDTRQMGNSYLKFMILWNMLMIIIDK